MKERWCWRCQMVIPMLEDHEWAEVHAAFPSLRSLPPGPPPSRQELFQPMLDLYEQLTGFRDTNPNALFHHRVSLFGPDCKHCGKALRTPRARMCVECGAQVDRAE